MKKIITLTLSLVLLFTVTGVALAYMPMKYTSSYIPFNYHLIDNYKLGVAPCNLRIAMQITDNIYHFEKQRSELYYTIYGNPIDRFKFLQLQERMLSLEREITSLNLEQAFKLQQ